MLGMIADGLAGRGYAVTIISFGGDGTPFFALHENVQILWLYEDNPAHHIPRVLCKYRAALRQEQPDVIVDVDNILALYTCPARRVVLGAKWVSWEHFHYFYEFPYNMRLRKVARRLACRHADRIVVLSDEDKTYYTENERIRGGITRIYNPAVALYGVVMEQRYSTDEIHSKEKSGNFIYEDSSVPDRYFDEKSEYYSENSFKQDNHIQSAQKQEKEIKKLSDEQHNIERISPLNQESSSEESEKMVLAAGRLTCAKGFDLLLEAWGRIEPRHSDWRLVIAGEGEERTVLEAQIHALHLQQVELQGRVADMAYLYRSAQIFALSSRQEGFAMVLLEAMAAGLPPVCFACRAGVREVVTNGQNGYLVAPGDVEAFASCLETLMQNENLRQRMGRAAQESMRRYNIEDILDQWEEIL